MSPEEVKRKYDSLPRTVVISSHRATGGGVFQVRTRTQWVTSSPGQPVWPDLTPARPPRRSLVWVLSNPVSFWRERRQWWQLKAYDRQQRREMKARQRSVRWPEKFSK